MAPARTIIIAGAGIGGLTAALALAKCGFGVVILEQSETLEDIGAGIQLSPNATRVLLELGLGKRLEPHVVTPSEVRIRASNGKDIAQVPLGDFAAERYGAPYWVIHRGDLQSVLLDAVRAHPDVSLRLDSEVEKFSTSGAGVKVHAVHGRLDIEADDGIGFDTTGLALIGADGLSSTVRFWLTSKSGLPSAVDEPRYSKRTAWRATIPYTEVPEEFRDSRVHLWLGRNAHLVHYPVKGSTAINIVAITSDDRGRPNWASREGPPDEVLAHYTVGLWSEDARKILSVPDLWLRWPLFDRPPLRRWSRGAVTLLGDAAHPMLPFLAQGAAMAIEDASMLAQCLGMTPDEPEQALRHYEDERQKRAACVQRTARMNGLIYHLGGPAAALRNLALRKMSGERLLTRYDWLYNWRPTSDPE